MKKKLSVFLLALVAFAQEKPAEEKPKITDTDRLRLKGIELGIANTKLFLRDMMDTLEAEYAKEAQKCTDKERFDRPSITCVPMAPPTPAKSREWKDGRYVTKKP